jgi:hypothetical protein
MDKERKKGNKNRTEVKKRTGMKQRGGMVMQEEIFLMDQ